MRHKVLFTSDIHGDEVQYRKLVDYAIEISPQSVIIGGDISPTSFADDEIITGQRVFLSNRLPELLLPLKTRLSDCGLLLMMGNDDCAVNSDVIEREDQNLFQSIHGKRIKLTEDFDLVGYSFVPITPFGLKDWEKYDLSYVPQNLVEEYERRIANNYELSGCRSTKLSLKGFRFTPEMGKKDSIQKDLTQDLFCKNPEKTVYVFHAPPNETNLDQLYDGDHVGSMAVRLFIERYQPYLTLHGHIHETVSRSGDYKQMMGRTLCLTAGNSEFDPGLAILVFDLYDPRNVVRRII